jgi:hypothetical protein
VVTAAEVTAAERSVAAEAITCAIAGNRVIVTSNRVRTAYEIAEIVDLIAFELDADVRIGVRPGAIEVRPAAPRGVLHVVPPAPPRHAREAPDSAVAAPRRRTIAEA